MSSDTEGKRVLIGVTGGMNSYVAAVLLRNQGFQVTAIHFVLSNPEALKLPQTFKSRCSDSPPAQAVQALFQKASIPCLVMDLQQEFADKVVDYFVHELLQQRTPNPCIQCHQKISLHYLFRKKEELNFDWMATGHYAQVRKDMGTRLPHLHKAVDLAHDQSYFLYGVSQEILNQLITPLGSLPHSMVLKMAKELGFGDPRKESAQELCFLDHPHLRDFMEARVSYVLRPRGIIRTENDQVIGEHPGLYAFRLGQQNIGLERRDADQLFVVGFDPARQALIIGKDDRLWGKELMATQAKWLHPMNGLSGLKCKARISPTHLEAACRVTLFENDTVHVDFDEPQRLITPGQVIVFYDGDEVLGGATIDQRGSPSPYIA